MKVNLKQIISKLMLGVLSAVACFTLLSNLPVAITTVSADSGVALNPDNFPDENFRSFISENYDKNKDGTLSSEEIKKITDLYLRGKNISSLKGIEFFTSLIRLDCYNNKLTSLDVSKNTALTSLHCNGNQLTRLDISKNTSLTNLNCNANQLTSLDVSRNTALERLECHTNNLTSLVVSNCTDLKWFTCSSNQLTSIDVSRNTALIYFSCDRNQLTSLDISKNTALDEFYCRNNLLTNLDISKNTLLHRFYCNGNYLTELNITNNGKLLSAYRAGEKKGQYVADSDILYSDGTNSFITDRTVTIVATAFNPGWNEKDGNWYYYKDNDVVTGWQLINGSWYYFNDDGVMQTGWREENGVWYYLKDSGAMATGWQWVGNVCYYFKSSGVMASEEYCDGYWLDKRGAWTYHARASWKQDSYGWYYQDTNGWYPKNQWLKIDDQWYFFKPDGYMATSEYWNGYWFNSNCTWTYQYRASWKQDSTGWWYGDDNGWYAKNQTLKIDGRSYNFDSNGYWIK